MTKKIKGIGLRPNSINGLDLEVERDAGNPVLILTGNQSIKFWEQLKDTCDDALNELYKSKAIGEYAGK